MHILKSHLHHMPRMLRLKRFWCRFAAEFSDESVVDLAGCSDKSFDPFGQFVVFVFAEYVGNMHHVIHSNDVAA